MCQKFDKIWNFVHSSYRFENNEDAKTEKCNSNYWCPGISDVNAFTVSRLGENNYLVPPIYLIHRVIAHIKQSTFRYSL